MEEYYGEDCNAKGRTRYRGVVLRGIKWLANRNRWGVGVRFDLRWPSPGFLYFERCTPKGWYSIPQPGAIVPAVILLCTLGPDINYAFRLGTSAFRIGAGASTGINETLNNLNETVKSNNSISSITSISTSNGTHVFVRNVKSCRSLNIWHFWNFWNLVSLCPWANLYS